jgi:hypothetical protein
MRYESLSLVFADWLTTTHTQYFICYICYLAQPGREYSRIEVENISADRLLFCRSELSAVRSSFCAKGQSLGAMRERAAFNVEGLSSSPVASEFARIIGYKDKL